MTAEPERAPPSDIDACPAWLDYSLGPVETIAIFAVADLADPNAPPDPWAEPAQSTPLAHLVEVYRLASEHSTPFGEEPTA